MTSVAPLTGTERPATQLFPTLTAFQIARVATYGRRRPIRKGEVLIEPGSPANRAYVVVRGSIDVMRPTLTGEALIVTHHPGQFSGEAGILIGRPAFVRLRVTEDGEVIEIDRAQVLRLLQLESEVGEIFMRAFILRRADVIGRGYGDTVLLGSTHCAGTLHVREFLSRNGHPFQFIDLDTANDVQELLDRYGITARDIPVVLLGGKVVLRNPNTAQLADALGFNESVDLTTMRDVVIIGAGPAGLGAAVYAASEGLSTLVVEMNAPGGQAGSSSRIENYLGFPNGISGQELAARAYNQAQKFGAGLVVAKHAAGLSCQRKPYTVEIDNGQRIGARAIIIATGALYRKPDLARMMQLEGAGVYYGATFMEAQLCREEEAIVIGGGNSAGQAAVFLCGSAKHVHLIVRSGGLADKMSRYLISRIESNPNITLHVRSELTDVDGERHVERVAWKNIDTGQVEHHAIRHVFVMTGAAPATEWLGGCVRTDDKGFIKTGIDLTVEDLTASAWPLGRPPRTLETSLPGVFAVGDVRAGSMKRVASAVGEGAAAVSLVHQALKE